MKELSIEQKARYYDEALKVANKYKDTHIMFPSIKDEMFPELAESEDERIRKDIIYHIEFEYSHSIIPIQRAKQWIAWLEKQADQKFADKVEPKFNVGDWITNGDYTWKIVEVKPLDYILQSQDGNIVDDTISHVDRQFHSFTIQDAKDGDVLACPTNDNCSEKIIFILRQLIDADVECYCCIDAYGDFDSCINTSNIIGQIKDNDYTPATKEQCDLLFQKMKEAGYIFDFDKKELKKVEQKSAEWSEEDEVFLELSLEHLTDIKEKYGRVYDTVDDCINWLESIKGRIQAQSKQVMSR